MPKVVAAVKVTSTNGETRGMIVTRRRQRRTTRPPRSAHQVVLAEGELASSSPDVEELVDLTLIGPVHLPHPAHAGEGHAQDPRWSSM
jgi:hypothetical protein